MSKGSANRSISQKFKNNFDNIKFGGVKWEPKPRKAKPKHHHIMPDIEPYRAVGGDGADKGEYITSRSKEREYLKRNNCIQVGNEKEHFFKHAGKSEDNPTKNWKNLNNLGGE